MAISDTHSLINPDNGFCSKTFIYHSLRPPYPLPPQSSPFSITDFVFSLLQTAVTPTASLIDAAMHSRIPYDDLRLLVRNLSASFRRPPLSLSHGACAFVISPNSSHLPILYLSLFSIGVVVSPSNPVSSVQEISCQIELCRPVVAFAAAESVRKLSEAGFSNPVVLIGLNEFEQDRAGGCTNGPQKDWNVPDFESMMRFESKGAGSGPEVEVWQSDTAAILYSSGTTGKVKGVKLTHRNLISSVAGAFSGRRSTSSSSLAAVYLCTVPYFHIYGFTLCLRAVAFGESIVSMSRFDLRSMLRSIEEFRVTRLAVAPPVVVALVDRNNDGLVEGSNWRSLETVYSGGAPLTVAVINKFMRRFPNVSISQSYGLTETTGGVSRVVGLYESTKIGSVGRLVSHCEAKIVDPKTGVGLAPTNPGELWIRGPFVMKGYVHGKDTMVESDGWLKTGDLCYFDNEGFLFVVDRLKELIKYKGYQVPPAELEHILHSHPDITEAAVIPYPDEEVGEVPMGFVVRRRGTDIDEAQVKAFVAEKVAPYKKLRRVRFVDSIPKNAPGKILRKRVDKIGALGSYL
ncbi:hypothetical protein OSB04_018548 [Centaurea solstitialis]|uniref:4-coumarate--CoA ligase n=1 Tax=Centaurea solstitialis TaxID=347529 RepID=A0AA38T534_9ASTR|nr:hypothetical protein OSB04_018548 [Centaurea solstitialis]